MIYWISKIIPRTTALRREIALVIVCMIITIVLFSYFYKIDYRNYDVPILYTGDALWWLIGIQNIIETGTFVSSNRMGQPWGFDLSAFPISELQLSALAFIFSRFSQSAGVVINNIFLFSGSLNFLSLYILLRRFLFNINLSIVGAYIFAFSTFFSLRSTNHLHYSMYYTIPLCIYVCTSFFELDMENAVKSKIGKLFIIIVISILLSTGASYYTFFGLIIILIALLLNIIYLRPKSLMSIWEVNKYKTIILLTTTILFLLTTISAFQSNKHGITLQRQPFEAEEHGLKIVRMLLPPSHDFGLPLISRGRNLYYQFYGFSDEQTSYLGVAGAIGMAYGCYLLLRRLYAVDQIDRNYITIIVIAGMCFLLSTVGGFSSIISFFITPQVRGYGRISIYIFCISIILLTKLLRTISFKNVNRELLVFLILPLFIIDQFYSVIKFYDRSNIASMFYEDKRFIQSIDKKIAVTNAVLTLPYVQFPEAGRLVNMSDYEHSKIYLHSKKIKISYGVYKNTENDKAYEYLSSASPKIMLKLLKEKKFAGIWINKDGFVDRGEKIIYEFKKEKLKYIEDAYKRYVYFYL